MTHVTADEIMVTRDDMTNNGEAELSDARPVGTLRRLGRNRPAAIALGFLGVVVLVAVFAPLVAPYGPLTIRLSDRLQGPSWRFLLGTDELGRDVLSRLIFGARVSLIVGVGSVALAAAIGGISGLVAGYVGGWVDAITMRLWDAMFALPVILIGVGLVASLGPGVRTTIAAVGIGSMPGFARIARASAIQERHKEYVEAVRGLGARGSRILIRHVLPNAAGPLLVQTAITMSFAVLAEAALSFLGLSAQEPTPSWGNMLQASEQYMSQDVVYAIAPGVALTVLVITLNAIADGLRQAFDVKSE